MDRWEYYASSLFLFHGLGLQVKVSVSLKSIYNLNMSMICVLFTLQVLFQMVYACYMNPSMHTCIRPCVHAYMHTSMHTCIHPCVHPCLHVYIHAYMHTSISTCIHTKIIPFNIYTSPVKWILLSHFTLRETKTQRGYVNCPRTHRCEAQSRLQICLNINLLIIH